LLEFLFTKNADLIFVLDQMGTIRIRACVFSVECGAAAWTENDAAEKWSAWHLADVGVLAHVRFAPTGDIACLARNEGGRQLGRPLV
jgi:hypothetical protein